jgi:hypothetical protein
MGQFWAPHIDVQPEDCVGAYVLVAARRESSTVTATLIGVSSFGIPARPTR